MEPELRKAFMDSIKKWAKLKTTGNYGSSILSCAMCEYMCKIEEYPCNHCHLDEVCDDPFRNYIRWKSKHNAQIIHKLIIDKYLEVRRS